MLTNTVFQSVEDRDAMVGAGMARGMHEGYERLDDVHAKEFCAGKLGFHVDVDDEPMEGIRLVRLTASGSACSIMVGVGVTRSEHSVWRSGHGSVSLRSRPLRRGGFEKTLSAWLQRSGHP